LRYRALPLDHPFRKMDNAITPHLGYVSEQNYRKYFPTSLRDIRLARWQAGAVIEAK
jgi:D-3-phosphoglycerate dehydrogenase